MLGHVSNGILTFVEASSTRVEISRDEFISKLTQGGLSCDLRGHRLVVTSWGRDFVPRVVQDYQLISEKVSEIFGWSFMFHASRSWIIEYEAEIGMSGRSVSLTPKLRGAGHPPKWLELEVLRILGYEPHTLQLPEPLAKVSGYYWSDVDGGMSPPQVVEVTCFGSEATGLSKSFSVSESDYRNSSF